MFVSLRLKATFGEEVASEKTKGLAPNQNLSTRFINSGPREVKNKAWAQFTKKRFFRLLCLYISFTMVKLGDLAFDERATLGGRRFFGEALKAALLFPMLGRLFARTLSSVKSMRSEGEWGRARIRLAPFGFGGLGPFLGGCLNKAIDT